MFGVAAFGPGAYTQTMHSLQATLALGLAAAGLASSLVGCSRAPFDPTHIDQRNGAAFGQIQVFKGHFEKTGSCYAGFRDETGEIVTRISLDDSGWVFAELPRGRISLSMVSCVVWNGLTFTTDGIQFDVGGDGATTYFGHVIISLPDNDLAIAGTIALNVLARVSVPGADLNGNHALEDTAGVPSNYFNGDARYLAVGNESAIAVQEYRRRYGHEPRVELPEMLIEPVPEPVWRGNRLSSRVEIEGVWLVWLGLARAGFTWSGLHLERPFREPGFGECKQLIVKFDQRELTLPVRLRRIKELVGSSEVARVNADVPTLSAIAEAVDGSLNLCGLHIPLTVRGLGAGRKFVSAFDERVAKLQQPTTTASDATPDTGGVAEASPVPRDTPVDAAPTPLPPPAPQSPDL